MNKFIYQTWQWSVCALAFKAVKMKFVKREEEEVFFFMQKKN